MSSTGSSRALAPAILLAAALAGVLLAPGTGTAQAASPEARIAFAVDTAADGRSSRIFVADPDGDNPRPVSGGTGRDRAPAFSPDGKSLAYQTTNELGLDTVMIQPLDGTKPRPVAVGASPQWSRDGKRLLFSRRQLNEYGLYVIRADGSQKDEGLKPIAKGQIGRWSPDERQLAAVAPVILEGRDRWQIQVMPVETLQPRLRLTLPESFGQVVSLDWAPGGGSLLFSVARQSRYELYVADLKSPEPRRVPAGEAVPNAAYGSWSPDGKEILFRSAADGMEGSSALSRVCLMRADGSNVRVLWEPQDRTLRVHGTAWHHPTVLAAVNPQTPVIKPPVPAPVPPQPPVVTPKPPVTPPARALGPPRKLHGDKLFTIDHARSPVSVSLAVPRDADFVVSVPELPLKSWAPRRQGVGLTLELEDGGLYRGTVIHSGVPWVTLQGRPRGGKVRLIDGKKLPPASSSFASGFKLSLRREGKNLIVAVNDQDVLTRPVLTSGVKTLSLTLENFDEGQARFNVGGIFYREWGTESPEKAAGTGPPAAPAPPGQ